jgi:hypothetical protein
MKLNILKHYDILTKYGFKVIPLRTNSKIPICKGWNKNWSREENRLILEKNPKSNIGLLLGKIIDVEGDTKEANDLISDCIGDKSHPCYMSNRSIHHLFLSPSHELRILKKNGVEFRGYGHQSVLPPSFHEGISYRWIQRFDIAIPEMPERLINLYRKLKNNKRILKDIKQGHMRITCFSCEKKIFIHKKRFELEIAVFKDLETRWVCQDCREYDIRQLCRNKKMEIKHINR